MSWQDSFSPFFRGFFKTIALAGCADTLIDQADTDVWAAHGCEQAMPIRTWQSYHFYESDWSDFGFHDDCNLHNGFTKSWNAVYLLENGLSDNYTLAFHSTDDYQQLAFGGDSAYHDDLHYQLTDDSNIFGRYVQQFLLVSSRHIELSCLLMDPPGTHANPASRASDFIHESWHAWKDKHGYQVDHSANPPGGQCTLSGNNCDHFYFRGIGAFDFGTLFYTDGTAAHFHTPNQVQVEFLCDLADFPKSWVSESVRQAARSDAHERAINRFINGPGYDCGEPRPW
jgi:hypothetical protein